MPHIKAERLVVEFPIYQTTHRSLKQTVMHATTGGRIARDAGNRVVVRAVDGVSFEIKGGDRVGLIGNNGAGKTTLLRVLSGIYEPLSGKLSVTGRTATLLDLTLGIDVEATGYENIVLRGIMAGLHPREVESKIGEIADFTDLGDYLDMPLKTYSAGMRLRLAFAVSTSIEADVLLMDEWLSVGDKSFSEKAAARLEGLIERSPILVLASHSFPLVSKICTRVFQLEQGKITEVPVANLDAERKPEINQRDLLSSLTHKGP
jgi:lipopolysaccharide transport system ATP-binding protein